MKSPQANSIQIALVVPLPCPCPCASVATWKRLPDRVPLSRCQGPKRLEPKKCRARARAVLPAHTPVRPCLSAVLLLLWLAKPCALLLLLMPRTCQAKANDEEQERPARAKPSIQISQAKQSGSSLVWSALYWSVAERGAQSVGRAGRAGQVARGWCE